MYCLLYKEPNMFDVVLHIPFFGWTLNYMTITIIPRSINIRSVATANFVQSCRGILNFQCLLLPRSLMDILATIIHVLNFQSVHRQVWNEEWTWENCLSRKRSSNAGRCADDVNWLGSLSPPILFLLFKKQRWFLSFLFIRFSCRQTPRFILAERKTPTAITSWSKIE